MIAFTLTTARSVILDYSKVPYQVESLVILYKKPNPDDTGGFLAFKVSGKIDLLKYRSPAKKESPSNRSDIPK